MKHAYNPACLCQSTITKTDIHNLKTSLQALHSAHGLLPKPKLTFEETSNVTLIIGFGRPPLLDQTLQRLPILS